MKRIFLLILMVAFNVNGQEKVTKKINYASIEIEVPDNYNSTSEYQIENEDFSAQWIYLDGKSFSDNMRMNVINQLGSQLKQSKISDVNFISSGGKFTGTKYYLENAPMKYRIYAYGNVNDQLVILNLGFKNDPIKSDNFDNLMLKFIKI